MFQLHKLSRLTTKFSLCVDLSSPVDSTLSVEGELYQSFDWSMAKEMLPRLLIRYCQPQEALHRSVSKESSNILPEMVKAGKNNLNFLDMLVDVMTTVWKDCKAPKE